MKILHTSDFGDQNSRTFTDIIDISFMIQLGAYNFHQSNFQFGYSPACEHQNLKVFPQP